MWAATYLTKEATQWSRRLAKLVSAGRLKAIGKTPVNGGMTEAQLLRIVNQKQLQGSAFDPWRPDLVSKRIAPAGVSPSVDRLRDKLYNDSMRRLAQNFPPTTSAMDWPDLRMAQTLRTLPKQLSPRGREVPDEALRGVSEFYAKPVSES